MLNIGEHVICKKPSWEVNYTAISFNIRYPVYNGHYRVRGSVEVNGVNLILLFGVYNPHPETGEDIWFEAKFFKTYKPEGTFFHPLFINYN